jgi:uncharacterized protein YaiL (DUF2058 family)
MPTVLGMAEVEDNLGSAGVHRANPVSSRSEMGNLRDQLIKKGLADEKRARAVAHEEKARLRRLSPEELEAERQAAEKKAQAEAEEKRAADRKRDEERRLHHDQEIEENRIPDLIRSGLVRDGGAGSRRFYFVTRESTISFIEVSDGASRSLADGRFAIVESGGIVPRKDFVLVASEQADEIARLDRERVRFWNRVPSGATRPSSP